VLPTLAVAVFPTPILARDDPMTVGEVIDNAIEEIQAIEKMTHCLV
jgi:hypothetical protein